MVKNQCLNPGSQLDDEKNYEEMRLRKEYVELALSLPPLPRELLSDILRKSKLN
jgi:hypothetical protein